MHVNKKKCIIYNSIYKCDLRRISNGDRLTSLVCHIVEWWWRWSGRSFSTHNYTRKWRKTDRYNFVSQIPRMYIVYNRLRILVVVWLHDRFCNHSKTVKVIYFIGRGISVFFRIARKRVAIKPPLLLQNLWLRVLLYYNTVLWHLINAVEFRRATSHKSHNLSNIIDILYRWGSGSGFRACVSKNHKCFTRANTRRG